MYDIYAQQVADNADFALNKFKQFDLSAGDIANMYFRLDKNGADKGSLINLVNNRIDIQGTVNAIKGGQIGGNLFFITPEGLTVGPSGVINAGSFTGLVLADDWRIEGGGLYPDGTFGQLWNDNEPNKLNYQFQNSFFKFGRKDSKGKYNVTDLKFNDKEINISGKINTRSGIVLGAGKVQVQNGAVLTGDTKLDFTNLVNASGTKVQFADGMKVSLTPVQDAKTGDIILRSEALNEYTKKPISSEIVESIFYSNNEATVDVAGEIATDGKVDISAGATTTFTNANWNLFEGLGLSPSGVLQNLLNDLGINMTANWANKTTTATAKLSDTGKITAGGNVNMQADATTSITVRSATVGKKAEGTSTAIPVTTVAVGYVKNKALVEVDGVLNSTGGDVSLAANAAAKVDLGAKAITLPKTDADAANAIYVGVSVAAGDNIAQVNVKERKDNSAITAKGDFKASAHSKSDIIMDTTVEGMDETFASTSVAIANYDSAANVYLGRSVNAKSITAEAENEVGSMYVSSSDGFGEGNENYVGNADYIMWGFKGDPNAETIARKIREKFNWTGVRNGGKLQGFENAFRNIQEYITAGASIAVVSNSNSANVTVAPGAELKATGPATEGSGDKAQPGGDITLTANTHMDSLHNFSVGAGNKMDQNTASKIDVAVGVLYSDIENNAVVDIQSNAKKSSKLDSANGSINLNAETVQVWDPWEPFKAFPERVEKLWNALKAIGLEVPALAKLHSESVDLRKRAESGKEVTENDMADFADIGKKFVNFINNEIANVVTLDKQVQGLVDDVSDLISPASYTNYYVRSYMVDSTDGQGKNAAIAGSFNIANLHNKAIVSLGEKTSLTAGKNIAIDTKTDTNVVSATGNGGEYFAFSESNGSGVGASVAVQDFSADSLILSGKNVSMTTKNGGDDSGEIALNAANDMNQTGIILSAGKADRMISGSGSLNALYGDSNSLVLVDDETTVNAKGALVLSANNDTGITNIVGGLALGSAKTNVSVGAGAALNMLGVNSIAAIADNGLEDGSSKKIANQTAADTDTEDFEKKSIEEQNKIKARNSLATARAVAEKQAVARKMAADFELSDQKLYENLGAKTAVDGSGKATAKGSLAAKDVRVTGNSDGAINAVALEGAYNSENHSAFDTVNNISKIGEAGHDQGTKAAKSFVSSPLQLLDRTFDIAHIEKKKAWSIGNMQPIQPIDNNQSTNTFNADVAGSVSWNKIESATLAYIDNVTMNLGAGNTGSLLNAASDDVFSGAWSGAAAVNWFNGGAGSQANQNAHKGGLGTALSVNHLDRDVKAIISNASITEAGAIENKTIKNGAEAAGALGLSVTNDSQGSGTNANAAFGLSLNSSDSDVHALLIDTSSSNSKSDKTAITNTAYDGDIQVSGGVDFAFANSADAGRTIAAGITAAVSDIENNIQSGIQGGSFTGVKDIKVQGEDALTQVNAAVALGISTSTKGLNGAGSLAYANLENTSRGYISGTSQIDATGEVSVTSQDVTGREENQHKQYLKDRKVDPTGETYLSSDTKKEAGTPAGSTIVNVAVEASGGKAATVGAAITVGDIDNQFGADVTNNKKLAAEAVKASADVHTNIVSVAAGASVSTKSLGGVGSISFNDLQQDNIVSVTGNRNGSADGITANTVSGTAKNTSHIVNVTGDFAGGKNAVGLALAYNRMDDTTGVYMANNQIQAKDTSKGVAVSLDADNDAYALALSVGAAATYKDDGKVVAHGNFAVNRGHNDTVAVLGEDRDGKKGSSKDKITNTSSVTTKATDKTSKTTIAGSGELALKPTTIALGVGVALTESDTTKDDNATTKETVRAEINNAEITTVKAGGKAAAIGAEISDTSKGTTVAVGAGLVKSAKFTAQGIGADANILKTNTAGLHDTTIDKNATDKGALVNVKANTASTIKTGAAAMQLSGENTFLTGVIAVGVNRIKDDTTAGITYSSKQVGKSVNAGNVDISAASQADILSVAAGASGTWKGSAAVGGSGSHNYIENNVAAKIEKANIESAGNIGVVARSDEAISNYAGVLDVALQGSTLSASIGVTGANNAITGKTEALVSDSTLFAKGSNSNKIKMNSGLESGLIDGAVTRNTWSAGSFKEDDSEGEKKYGVSRLQKGRKEEEKTGVVVDASATHSISSVMANGGVAVNMNDGQGSGMAGSIAGVVNLNEVGGATTAKILDTKVNSASRPDRPDVTVHAADYTNVAEFSAAAAIGVAQTGAIGAGFTGADNEITRVTAAGISTAKATMDGQGVKNVPTSKELNSIIAHNVAVTADAKQAMSAFNVAGVIAGSKTFSAQTGDNVNNNKLAGATIATITNTWMNHRGKATVEATHEDAVYDLNIAAGAAISPSQEGIALSLNVGVGVVNEESLVTADVQNSTFQGVRETGNDKSRSEFSLNAKNSTKLEATLVSAGASVSPFSGGIASSVAVNNIENQVTSRIAGSTLNEDTITVNADNTIAVEDRTGTGAAGLITGIGVGVDVTTLNDAVSAVIENSELNATEKLAITTQSQRDIDSIVAGASVGGAEVGVNVLAVTVASGLGDTDDIKEDENNKGSFSHKEAVKKTLEIVKERVNADLSEHFYGMTEEEVENMKEKMKTDANTGDGITGAGVHTYVQDSKVKVTEGAATIVNSEYNDAKLDGGQGGLGAITVNVTDTLYHLNQQNDIDVDNTSITAKSIGMLAQQGNKGDSDEAIRVRAVEAGLGTAGVGVGYGGIVTKGATGVSINKGTLVTTDGDLDIETKDTAKSKTWVLGVGANIGGNVLVTVANNEDKANNYIIVENDSSLKAERKTKTEKVKVKDDDGTEREVTLDLPAILSLKAERAGKTASKNLGVGVGAASVVVNNAYAEDEGKSLISVNGSNSFTADRMTMEATNAPVLKAEAGGTGVALIGVTVMNSTASAKSQALVTVADNNKLLADAVDAKAVIGETGTDMTHAVTTSTSIELAAGVAPSTSEASTATTAEVKMGKAAYKTVEKEVTTTDDDGNQKTETVTERVTDLAISTENNASRRSIVDNFNLGLVLSVGSGDAISKGDDKSLVTAKGGDVNSLKISAGGSGKTSGFADGGSGGAVDIGAIANLTLDTKTTNIATLSGTWNVNDLAAISAGQEIVVKGTSKTGAGGVFTIDWSDTDNYATMNTKTVLDKGAVLNAGRTNVKAANKLDMGAYDNESYMNHMNIGGILNISRDTKSDVKIDTKANIEVGENSKVTTKEGQVYDAHTELELRNKVEGKGGGMLGENVFVYSNNDVTAANGISVGKNASLNQDGEYDDGDLVLSASDDLNLTTVGESYVGALGGTASADAVTNVARSNKIRVDGTLASGHDINLYAGADADGAEATYKVNTAATAHNNTLLGFYTDPAVKYDRKSNQQVEIGSEGNATAIRNINILAGNGKETVKREASKKSITTWYSVETGEELLTESGGNSKITETNNNYVKVDGSLKTGMANKAIVYISGSALPEGMTAADGSKDSLVINTDKSTIDFTKDPIKTGTMDYATQLGKQLAAVEELITEYNTGSKTMDTAAYYGYVQQRQRILEDLEKHGLVETQVIDGKTVRVYKTDGVPVAYVEIPEILVSGGNIIINAENLTGKGKMDAGGKPEVKINNTSNAYLKLDGARVGDPGGEIFFKGTGAALSSVANNDAINKLNKDKNSKAAFADIKNDAASGEVSGIVVDNTKGAETEIAVKDSQGNTGTYHAITDVAVTGDLRNDTGEIVIDNTHGDIFIGSGSGKGVNIIGRTVRLKATGSITQDYVDGVVDIGGIPYQMYTEEVEEAKKAADKEDISKDITKVKTGLKVKDTDITQASAGKIAGGSIYISAADINVNGLIQSGFSKYEVEVPENFDESKVQKTFATIVNPETGSSSFKVVNVTEVVNGRTMYKVNDGDRMVYDDKLGAFKYVVQMYYDPQTKNLVVKDIDTKGGRIYLSGRIASTGQGKILAMDGGADISITNNSGLSMEVGKILNNDTEGRISITDVAKNTWTEYTRNATNSMSLDAYGKYLALTDADKEKFAMLTDAQKAEMLGYKTDAEKKQAAISFGKDGIGYYDGSDKTLASYDTVKGRRYNWTLGSETGTTTKYHKKDTTIFWDAYDFDSDTSSMSQHEKSEYVIDTKDKGKRSFKEGIFIGEIPDDEKYKDLAKDPFGYVYENRITSESRALNAAWVESKWLGAYKEYHVQWTKKTGSTQSLTFSLLADKPIGIGFIGKEDGTIELKNSLGKNAQATNPVDLILTDNILNNTADGLVSLQADKGSVIQKDNTSITTGNVHISALNDIDNIHITSLGIRTKNDDGTYTASDGVLLYAQSNGGGNVDVDVIGGTVEGQALPGNVIITESVGSLAGGLTGKPGNVELTAEGNITQEGTEATVRGLRVTLASSNGGIGTKDQDIVLDTPAEPYGMSPDTAAVNASARDSIYLKEEKDDMRVGNVISLEGDVSLTAEKGRLLDALPEEERTNNWNEEDLVKRWIDAGLIAGTPEYKGAYITSLEQDKAKFENNVKEQYALCVSGEASDQIKEVYMTKQADGTWKFKYDSAQAYLDSLLAEKSSDHMNYYQNVTEAINNPQYKWTKEQLLYAIRYAIVNKESGVNAETQKKVANVMGKNVTLTAQGVGMHSDKTTTILAKDISGGSEAAIANLKLLANADAGDVTMYDAKGNILRYYLAENGEQVMMGFDATDPSKALYILKQIVDKSGNKTLKAYDASDPTKELGSTEGLHIDKFVIGNMSPLGVKATGQVNITASGDNAFIAGRSDEKGIFSPVNTGIITAVDQDVRLYTQEGIYNALKGADVNYGNIHAKNLLAYGGTKDIGASNKYLGVSLSGDLLTAAADGSVYIRNMLNTEGESVLRLGSLYAGDTISLISPEGFAITENKDYALGYLNAGKRVELVAESGTAGSQEDPLRILNSGGEISVLAEAAYLKGVKGLQGDDTTMKLGAIETDSELYAESEGKLETTGQIVVGNVIDKGAIVLSANSDITLNSTVISGNPKRIDDEEKGGIWYDGGGSVRLQSDTGSITEAGKGVLQANDVTTVSAGGVKLANDKNVFSSFTAHGAETDDSQGKKEKAINGSVVVHTHAGNITDPAAPDLDVAVYDTVYGNVEMKNLDAGNIMLAEDITAKKDKNGKGGSVTLATEGEINVNNHRVEAAKDVKLTTGNGSINVTGSTIEGGNILIASENGAVNLDGRLVAKDDIGIGTDGGEVTLNGRLEAGDELWVQAGTGNVAVNGELEAKRKVNVQTAGGNIALNGSVAAGEPEANGDGMIYAGGEVGLATGKGSITQTGNSGILTESVTASAAGEISLTSDKNVFSSFAAGGAETGKTDAQGNPVKEINGNVTLRTHGGSNLSAGIMDTVYGNVDMQNLDGGSLLLTSAITAKKTKNSNSGNINLIQPGSVIAYNALNADRDINIDTRDGDGAIMLAENVKAANIATKTNDGMIFFGGTTRANNYIMSETVNGDIVYSGDVRSSGKITAVAEESGDITYFGKVRSGSDITAATKNGEIWYNGDVDAGGRVAAQADDGVILYAGNVHGASDVTGRVGTGSVMYGGTVTAGGDVVAEILQRGDILYMGNVKAGRDVIARTAAGDILYMGNVDAGRNVISSTGQGRIGYLGSVMAGKDLPEQVTSGLGKIAYYDRYGLVGYGDTLLGAAPVRNATEDELDVDEDEEQ